MTHGSAKEPTIEYSDSTLTSSQGDDAYGDRSVYGKNPNPDNDTTSYGRDTNINKDALDNTPSSNTNDYNTSSSGYTDNSTGVASSYGQGQGNFQNTTATTGSAYGQTRSQGDDSYGRSSEGNFANNTRDVSDGNVGTFDASSSNKYENSRDNLERRAPTGDHDTFSGAPENAQYNPRSEAGVTSGTAGTAGTAGFGETSLGSHGHSTSSTTDTGEKKGFVENIKDKITGDSSSNGHVHTRYNDESTGTN